VLELNPHLARALTYAPASNRLTLYALDGDRATPLASETPPKLVLVASCGAHIACAFHEGEKNEILRPGVVELRNWQDLAVITRIALDRVWFQSMALAPDATLIAIASTAENTLLMSTRDGKLIAISQAANTSPGLVSTKRRSVSPASARARGAAISA
jgi:hypothetical protein